AFAHRVLRGPLHAEVASQAADEQLTYLAFAQVARQPGGRSLTGGVPAIAEAAVRVGVQLRSLPDDGAHHVPRQRRVKLRTRCSLNTVIRPQDLVMSVQADDIQRGVSGVAAGE